MKSPWKTLKSKIVYQNNWIKVIENTVIRPDGKEGIYSVVETNGDSVFIVAINELSEIILVNQYRYPVQRFSLEIPAGNSDGQEPLAAAKRELWEETGYTATTWNEIGYFCPFNGITKEFTHVYIAQDLIQTNSNKMAEDGIDKTEKVSLKQVLNMINSGEIIDGQSITSILLAQNFLNK